MTTKTREKRKVDDLDKDESDLSDEDKEALKRKLDQIKKEAGGHRKWVCANPGCVTLLLIGPQTDKSQFCQPVPYEPPC